MLFFVFRAVSKTRAEQNVQADVKLVFSETSTEPIPSGTSIVETLKEAAAAPNSTFNLVIDTNSILVVSKCKSQMIYSRLTCPISMKFTVSLSRKQQFVILFKNHFYRITASNSSDNPD